MASSTRLSLELQEAKKHQSVVKADITQVRTFSLFLVLSIIFAKKDIWVVLVKFSWKKKFFNYFHFGRKEEKEKKLKKFFFLRLKKRII